MDISIEPMSEHHIEQIHTIECACFVPPWSVNAFMEELDNPMAIYIAACVGGFVAGFAGMWHVVNEGHITNIAVAKEYRGRGIGDALVKQLVKIAGEKGMIGLTLEVRAGNTAAQRLYKKNGFEIGGIRKDYYYSSGTKEDAIVMWKYCEDEGGCAV